MNPIEAMARAHWEAGRTAGWPMLEELTDAQRYDLKEQMRAALIALRDHKDTPSAVRAWVISALEKQP